jgi:hypothetical protein
LAKDEKPERARSEARGRRRLGQGRGGDNHQKDTVEKDYLVLKRASASRPSGEWSDEDYDVLADGVVVGRIFLANAAPVGASWMWTLLLEHHKDRTTTRLRRDPRGCHGRPR